MTPELFYLTTGMMAIIFGILLLTVMVISLPIIVHKSFSFNKERYYHNQEQTKQLIQDLQAQLVIERARSLELSSKIDMITQEYYNLKSQHDAIKLKLDAAWELLSDYENRLARQNEDEGFNS